ncbi:heterocyst formation ABC transporter subunit HepA [Euhalothece natronophila]|uniref:heterocyst formation ABC transporter subunit HepA n=1 Tax=Euhalothece natronophila TaxID=577489 RepID=UPI001FEC6A23|nr:heterocyst formation ABC transporter subunit HepA [Euhalothece natronophila]
MILKAKIITSRLGNFSRRWILATHFWQENFLILREFKYFPKIAFGAIALTLLSAFFEGATVGLIASFLQGLTSPNEPPIETGIRWLDVWVLATTASAQVRIYRLGALILLAVWLRSLLNYFGQFYSQLSQLYLADSIRKRLFNQLQDLSLSYYAKTRSGELINSITSEVDQLQHAFGVISHLMTRGSTLIAYIISMFWLSWQLTIIALMLFALLSVGLSNLIARVREASFALPKAKGNLTSVIIEFINGIRTIRASANQGFEERRFYQASQEVIKVHYPLFLVSNSIKPLAEAISSSILVGMVVVAFNILIVDGDLRAASLLTFMFVLFRMMPLVSEVNNSRGALSQFQGSIDNIKQLLKSTNKSDQKNGYLQFKGLQQGIEFIGVEFGYTKTEPVLRNINLLIPKGKTTALVGASGAGKTTLADLIPRFYDPLQGQILIDGVDLQDFEINSLRRQMSVVSQDTFLFNKTIRYNIAYGVNEIDDGAIWEVARLANATQFIQELPQQLDTLLGDRGIRLSGGQRQRIAIARALLRDPEILILDEATSALDSITEKLIQESLEKLSTGRTVITIAHRLSTIKHADQVVVLEQGQIVEQGNYEELLQRQGKLWSYHQVQSFG